MYASVTNPRRLSPPHTEQGLQFWEQLAGECREHIQAINTALSERGHAGSDLIELRTGEQLQLIRSGLPSTTLRATIEFENWGAVIRVSVRGHQTPDFSFYPQDMELPLAKECDGSLVAIFDEGKSLCPCELAAYLAQHFRRCFPNVALPCSEHAVGARS